MAAPRHYTMEYLGILCEQFECLEHLFLTDSSSHIEEISWMRYMRYSNRGPAHGIYFGYFPDISVWPAAMFEGNNVQWRLGKIAFHIADKLRRQLTRQG